MPRMTRAAAAREAEEEARQEAEEAARAAAELEARKPPPGWLAGYCSSAGTQLTPLIQALGLLGAALLACADRGWRQAIEQFRSEETSLDDVNHDKLTHVDESYTLLDDAWNRGLLHFMRCVGPQVLPRYRRLRELDLWPYLRESWWRLTDLGGDQQIDRTAVFTALANGAWPELRVLTARPDTNAERDLLLDGVLRCPSLQQLHTGSLTDAAVQKLLGCQELLKISNGRSWEWDHRHSFPELAPDPAAVATGPGCQKLQHLILDRCPIHVAMLDVAKTCQRLRVLSLRGCENVTAESVAAIGGSRRRRRPQLEYLNLPPGCPQLEYLNLNGCKNVGDVAIAAIVQGCLRLKTVDLIRTSISSDGFATILTAPLLTRLEVADTWDAEMGPVPADRPVLTWEAVVAARQQYPDLQGLEVGRTPRLRVKTCNQDGDEIYFALRSCTRLKMLMRAYCNRQGVSMNSVRFLLDGNRINETQTPAQLDMEDGDVIDIMIEQQGFLAWAAAPSPTEPTAADQVLHGAASANALAPAEVAALVAAAAGPHAQPGRAEVVMARQLLSAAQCAALVAHSEQAFRASGDGAASWTLETSCAELSSLVGAPAVAALCALGRDALRESRPHAPESQIMPLRVALRRRAAAPGVVKFHRDARRVVLHLPLNAGFEGGRLLLAIRGRELHSVPVAAGTGTAIDNATVHGVSCVTAGVRYTLLAVFDG